MYQPKSIPSSSVYPAGRPVRFAPDPENDVAVTRSLTVYTRSINGNCRS
jgi:hypothetical protein